MAQGQQGVLDRYDLSGAVPDYDLLSDFASESVNDGAMSFAGFTHHSQEAGDLIFARHRGTHQMGHGFGASYNPGMAGLGLELDPQVEEPLPLLDQAALDSMRLDDRQQEPPPPTPPPFLSPAPIPALHKPPPSAWRHPGVHHARSASQPPAEHRANMGLPPSAFALTPTSANTVAAPFLDLHYYTQPPLPLAPAEEMPPLEQFLDTSLFEQPDSAEVAQAVADIMQAVAATPGMSS